MSIPSPLLTIQYLENSPALAHLDQVQVVDKLRAVAERLPLTHLLIGWHVPPPLLEACRVAAQQLGLRFLLWQPLLTPFSALHPNPDWSVRGLMGNQLEGYRGLPEFTFACPNHPAVQDAVLGHVEFLVHQGIYQGFFFDRVRFPSPAANPIDDLACFCVHCQRKAAENGLDLDKVKSSILDSIKNGDGSLSLVKSLLSGVKGTGQADHDQSLHNFLAFRKATIRDFLSSITPLLRAAHLEIGLDCYSPSLTHMVGQDLAALGEVVDWIKLMTYAHTLAPAGIPYELSGLVCYLTLTTHSTHAQVLDLIGQAIGLPLPTRLTSLEQEGLSSPALSREVGYGVLANSRPVLAGIELVNLAGVTNLNPAQIRSDLTSLKGSRIAGLSLSWDLLHMPLEWLDLVRQVYYGPENA